MPCFFAESLCESESQELTVVMKRLDSFILLSNLTSNQVGVEVQKIPNFKNQQLLKSFI